MGNNQSVSSRGNTRCVDCPLRANKQFRPFTDKELAFVSDFKRGELTIEKGGAILTEGTRSPHVYTVLTGISFRYKMLADGRRQVLNFAFPGDIVGLQNALDAEMSHSIEALTAISLCVFERARLPELYQGFPHLAYDLTWLAARELGTMDQHLVSVGRRTALEKAAYLAVFLHGRALETGVIEASNQLIPVTQSIISDALGLSTVHTNKTLRKLVDRNLIEWRDGGFVVVDLKGLKTAAQWEKNKSAQQKPFL